MTRNVQITYNPPNVPCLQIHFLMRNGNNLYCLSQYFSNTFSQWRASYINVNIEEYWLRQYKLFPLRIKKCICKHGTFGEFYVICTFLVILMIFAIHFHNGVPRLLMFTF